MTPSTSEVFVEGICVDPVIARYREASLRAGFDRVRTGPFMTKTVRVVFENYFGMKK